MPDMAKYIRPTMLGAIALLPTTVWAQHTNTSEDSTKLKSQRLQEVIVTSHSARQRVETIQIGSEFLNLQELSKTPALFGQNDIMRSIQLLPGSNLKMKDLVVFRFGVVRLLKTVSCMMMRLFIMWVI